MKAKAELDLGKLVRPSFTGKNTGTGLSDCCLTLALSAGRGKSWFETPETGWRRDLQAEVSSAC